MAYMRDASGKRLDSLVVASQYGVNRPSPGKLAWTNLTAISPTPVPRSIGTDGWVYAALSGGSNRMTRSGDGFATVETTFRFSDAPISDTRAVQYVTRTPEGYVAILCDAAGTTASIYFSTQWNVAASWAKVLDLGMVANISISRWVPRSGGQGTVQLVGEYGNADTRSLYLTENGGQTWRVIRTHTRQAGGAGVNNHFHGACYDPATGRIWSSAGDEANNWFGYTDDEGATWVSVPANGVGPESGGTPFNHPTVVTPTSKRIITTPDGAVGNTGIWEIDKVTGKNAVSHEVARTQPFRQWSRAPWAQDGDELYLLFPPDTTLGDTARIFVAATGDGGDSWHIVHEEAIDQANDQYFVGIVGPDSAGRIYLTKSNGGVVSLRSAPKLTWHRTATGAALADLPERLSENALAAAIAPTKAGLDTAAGVRSALMRAWWAALADVDNNPADILVVDDSTGEGQGTTTTKPWIENTWPRRLAAILRQQFMTTPTGSPAGYIPAWYAATGVTGAGFVWANSPNLDGAFSGLGSRSTKLTATGQTGTIVLSGMTSFDAVFTKASGGGSFSVAIDGGAATTISVANATTAYGQRQRFTLPDTGNHTVVVAWVSGQVWFEGLMTYNGDETKGIRYWDSTHAGFRSGQLSGDAVSGGGTPAHTWDRSIPSTIAIAFNGMGLNDYGANLGSATYKTYMGNLNAAIRAKIGPTVPLVMLAKYRRTDGSGTTAEASEPWANYVAALKSLAAADPYLHVIDLSARMLPPSQDTLGLVSGDQVHMTNKGHRFVAHEIARAVSPLAP